MRHRLSCLRLLAYLKDPSLERWGVSLTVNGGSQRLCRLMSGMSFAKSFLKQPARTSVILVMIPADLLPVDEHCESFLATNAAYHVSDCYKSSTNLYKIYHYHQSSPDSSFATKLRLHHIVQIVQIPFPLRFLIPKAWWKDDNFLSAHVHQPHYD